MMYVPAVLNVPTPAPMSLNGLRDALEQAERLLVRLDRDNIQQFLLQMDAIESMWVAQNDPAAVRAEEGRWQSLLKRITTNPKLLTDAAAQVGGLTKLRSQHAPATGLWWHVDEQVAQERGKTLRTLAIVVGVAALVFVVFWLMNTFADRTPSEAAVPGVGDSIQQLERLVEAQSWEEAQVVVDGARQNAPDDAALLVWDAVLAERLGDAERSQTSVTLAQEKFTDSPAAFWLLLGDSRLQASDWDGADAAAQEALTLAPQDANVLFLLGRVAEARGDRAQAAVYFEETIVLAGDSNPELVALVKIRMGMLMQSVDPFPGPAPIPEVSPTVTP